MAGWLILSGFTILCFAVFAVIRGRLGWARIRNRGTAAIVLCLGLFLMMIGGALAPPPENEPGDGRSVHSSSDTGRTAGALPTTTAPLATTTAVPAPSAAEPFHAGVHPARTTSTTPPPPPSAPASALGVRPAPTIVAAPPLQATPPAYPAPPAAPVAPQPAPPSSDGWDDCGADSYINSDGNCVPRPQHAPSAPAGATAKCEDGTYSFSQNRRGTCSGHGGVASWL